MLAACQTIRKRKVDQRCPAFEFLGECEAGVVVLKEGSRNTRYITVCTANIVAQREITDVALISLIMLCWSVVCRNCR